jgi:diguanylate cyclase (GGDEF)-like protein
MERARILLADDDDVSRDAVARELRAAGFSVEEVQSTDDLVSRVARGGLDLVLLDATMQGPRGLEACRTLKGMAGDAYLPIVLFAVRTDPESRVLALIAGADECVDKPILVEELRAAIDRHVEVKRLSHDATRARSRLDQALSRDALTGAGAYGVVRARLKEEFARAEVQHEPLACCLLDIDHLRLENERFGREAGDAALRLVADAIKTSIRDSDAASRFGPDEFILLLPVTHFVGSVRVALRILKEVESRTLTSGGPSRRVSVSLGVALFPSRDVRTEEALILAADRALGQAKREGGGRVCVFQQDGQIYTPTAGDMESPFRT